MELATHGNKFTYYDALKVTRLQQSTNMSGTPMDHC